MPAEPKESAEPRTEALSAEEVRFVRKHRNVGYVATLPDAVRLIDSLLATLDAATEARRELLAKVEAMDGVLVPMPRPQRGDHDYGINDPKLVYAAAVIRLIEERP